MKSTGGITWIDDNPERKRTADDLGARFVDVKGMDLQAELAQVLEGHQPGLLIVDHILDKAKGCVHPVLLRGSTVAEAAKERWPACPVVGVTNVDKLAQIDVRTRNTYDCLFPFVEFRTYISRIPIIQTDFAKAARAKNEPLALIRLLKPPRDDVESLLAAMPHDLKSRLQDASCPSRLFRWVNHLMARPGFLLDDLWAATVLGLTTNGFSRVQSDFASATYKGVFLRPDEPRWWRSRLLGRLWELVGAAAGESSWQAGVQLPGIGPQESSRCHRCDQPFPETVAYLDETSAERHPMHLRCSMLHPQYNRELYLEDVRMMIDE